MRETYHQPSPTFLATVRKASLLALSAITLLTTLPTVFDLFLLPFSSSPRYVAAPAPIYLPSAPSQEELEADDIASVYS